MHFTVRTDHASLRYLINFKDPTGQLARWIDSLSEYDFDIIPRPGRKNGNADSLSRIPCGGKRCICEYACSDPTLPDFEENPCPLRVVRDQTLTCENVDLNSVYSAEIEVLELDEVNVSQSVSENNPNFPFPWTKESMNGAQKEDSVLKEVI